LGTIYVIENKANGKRYIGSTTNLRQRWRRHRTDLRGGYHGNPHLQNAWLRYGEEAFAFVILEENIPDSRLIEQEQYWMDEYKQDGEVYNFGSAVEHSMKGRSPSEETRCKLSKAARGRKHSAETRRKLSEARQGKKNPFYGRTHSVETCRRMSVAHQRENLSEETLHKMSLATRGEKNPNYGDVLLSQEAHRKIGMASARPYPAFRHRETGEIIPAGQNLNALCRERGLKQSSMWGVIHDKQNYHKGWGLL